jgi:nucleotidyltransferase/DNA polymerase involved in DNA repair
VIACLSIPFFAAAVEERHDRGLARRALVIGGRPWEPRPVYSFSRLAARQGVRPGMSLRLAHTCIPQAEFLPAAEPRYLAAAGQVTDLLADFTPRIEPEALWLPDSRSPDSQPGPAQALTRVLPACYSLDLEQLPSAEALKLAQEIGRRVRGVTELSPAIGLAENKFTAQVAAALTRPNHTRPVSAGGEAEFLADCSLSFLPLEQETARRLRLMGIRTLGQLTALPADQLQEQFGPAILPLVQQAAGRSPQLSRRPDHLASLPDQPAIAARHYFAEPVADRQVIERVLDHLADHVAGQLAEAKLVSRVLYLEWQAESGPPGRLTCPLSQQTADPARLATNLNQLSVQAQPAWHDGLRGLTVTAGELTPRTAYQLALFEPTARPADLSALSLLLNKHGADAFYRPLLADTQHPLPERRFRLQALAS